MAFKPQGIKAVLKKFTDEHGHDIFYIEDIQKWVESMYSRNHQSIINRMLNSNSIIELGDSAYKFEG